MIKKKFILIAGFIVSIFAVATEVSAGIMFGFNHVVPVSRTYTRHHNRCHSRHVYYPAPVRTRYVEPVRTYYVEPECDYIEEYDYEEPYYTYYEKPCRHDYDDYDYYYVRKPRRSFMSFGFGW